MKFPRQTIKVGDCIVPVNRWNKPRRDDVRPGTSYEGEMWYSARLSFHLNVHPVPRVIGNQTKEGLVLHKCDNIQCINPDHLYLGSRQQNVADAIERSGLNGERHKAINSARMKSMQNDPRIIEARSKGGLAAAGKPRNRKCASR